MKVHVISDLHTEFLNQYEFNKLLAKYFRSKCIDTILILAGDIGNPFSDMYYNLLSHVSKLYTGIFLCAGNHEFYGSIDMDYTCDYIYELCNKFDNVHFLNRNVFVFENFVILGCTLWTNIKSSEKFNVKCTLNDYNLIKDFTISKCNKLHERDLTWLDNTLSNIKSKHVIVVTHHLPTYDLLNSIYTSSLINSAFANTDCDELISKTNYWICGHTHKFKVIKKLDCTLICNPIGYKNENKQSNIYEFYLV